VEAGKTKLKLINVLLCRKGVGLNSIECIQCSEWIHGRCSGVSGKLLVSDVRGVLMRSCFEKL